MPAGAGTDGSARCLHWLCPPPLQGKYTEAADMYTKALIQDPMDANASKVRWLRAVLPRRPRHATPPPLHPQDRQIVNLTERRQDKAEEYLAAGNYSMVDKLVGAARADAPACQRLQEMRVAALAGMGRYDDAYALTTELLPQFPRSVALVQVRAQALARQGNIEAAVTSLRAALRSDPDAAEIKAEFRKLRGMERHKAAGNDAFKAGRWADAIAEYSSALALDPANAPFNSKLLANRAAARMKLRQWAEAAADCTACLELDDSYLKAYLRRAQCLKEVGDAEALETACRDLEAAKRLAEDRDTMRNIERDLRQYRHLLKAAKRKDYYKILGVPRSASQADIKKAYRKMALKCHPDRFASKGAEEKKKAETLFKDINEANAVLSDATKKARYDSGVDIEDLDGDGPGGFHGGGGGMQGGVPEDIFRMFFGGGGGGGGGRRRGGGVPFHFG